MSSGLKGDRMANKLIQGSKIPNIMLRLVDGHAIVLPEQMLGRYLALIFYRGTWCPYCKRQLASYQAKLAELEKLGVSVVAAAVDDLAPSLAMAQELGLTFPLAYGVTAEDVAGLDPWWTEDNHGRYIQPMEFLVLRGGTVFGSIYASGPVGRMGVEEVLNSVRNRERRRLEQEAAQVGAQRPA